MPNGVVIILLTVIAVIAAIVFVIVAIVRGTRRAARYEDPLADPHWLMHPFHGAPDGLGQVLLALAAASVAVTLLVAAPVLGRELSGRAALFIGVVLTFALAYWQRAPLLIIVAALGTYSYLATSMTRWTEVARTGAAASSTALALAAVVFWLIGRLGEAGDKTRRFGFQYWLWGMLGLVVVLFSTSTQEAYSMFASTGYRAIVGHWQLAAALGLLVVAAVGLLALAVVRKRVGWIEAALLAVTIAIFVGFALPRASYGGGDFFMDGPAKLTTWGLGWAIAFNALLLATLLGLVAFGYLRREDWLVNLGAVFLFAFVVVKYFDWAFTFLDRSLAFVVAGLLFLGVGFLMERGRRYVISAMDSGEAHD